MKLFTTFFVFLLSFGISFASSDFYSKLNVFENYLKNQKSNIEKIYKQYGLNNSESKNRIINDTDEIITIIKKLKRVDIEKKDEEIILKTISDKINTVSQNTKKRVKTEIEIHEKNITKTSNYYKKVSLKIEKSLSKIIKNTYKTKVEKNKNSLKKEQILQILVNLKEKIKALNSFGKISFKSEEIMKNSFLRILTEIKKEIVNLKKNLK